MPTLSASSSVFQLAFGVNAVLPVLISDFEAVRKDAAESLLRKIKEYCPGFELKERDRIDFVDFTFQSSRGLRHARFVTYFTGFFSLAMCGLSLTALCLSALKPEWQISVRLFLTFTGATLIAAPLIYVGRNAYLKWLYSLLVSKSSNEQHEAVLFAECVNIYVKHKKEWEQTGSRMDEAQLQLEILGWEMRWMRIKMRLIPMREWIRSKLRLKRPR